MRPEQILKAELLHALDPAASDPLGLVDQYGKRWDDYLPIDPILFAPWRLGHTGSMNHPRMAMGVAARWRPEVSRALWTSLLRAEHGPPEDDQHGRAFGLHSFELQSRTYWTWNVGAAWVAWSLTEDDELREVLQHDLVFAFALMAFTMIPRYRVKSANGRVQYEGPHTVTAGIRALANSMIGPDADRLMAYLLEIPVIDRYQGEVAFARGLTKRLLNPTPPRLRAAARELLETGSLGAAREVLSWMTGPRTVRTLVPFHVVRYRSGVATAMDYMLGGLTGSTFGGLGLMQDGKVTTPAGCDYLLPYPAGERVRSGSPFLGRGEATLDVGAARIEAWNRTEAEGGRRIQTVVTLPPISEALWRLDVDLEGPRLTDLGHSAPGPKPTPKPPKPASELGWWRLLLEWLRGGSIAS